MLAHGTEQITAKRAAVARLYESHFERVVRYIAARIGNPSDSEDLAGEVFVRALRRWTRSKRPGLPWKLGPLSAPDASGEFTVSC